MRKSFLHYSCIGLFIVAACSDEDADETPAEASTIGAARPAGEAGDSGTAAPPEPADAGAPAPEATGTLQPALPVTENADHEALLDSPDPALAANKRLVYDVWRTLIEARDTEAAQQYLAESYIQHNPNADTGRAGVLAFFASLGAPLPVEERVQAPLVAIVAEGDYVAIARVDEYTEPRPYTTTWFDLFRIEAGVIAEHWDHGRLPAGATPSAYVPPVENPDQEASLESTEPQLEANKRLVHEMWRTLLDGQQVEEAPRFLAEGYVQHNPQANTGLEGFLTFFRQFAQPQPVQPGVANFIQMIAEDDLVVLATVRSYDDANGVAYTTTWFDMFRVSDEKLVEHWDTATLQ
jgi:predicted SnoaL-like aldol condensation-catalyzing enzyme